MYVLSLAADSLRPPLAPAFERRYLQRSEIRPRAVPNIKEIFFDDDTFNYRKERTIELCSKLKKLNFTWSCTSRVTTDYDTLKAMKDAGCRLLIVGYESGDPQILKNIKKGATVDMAERFTANCKRLGLLIHGDFIVGLPGESRESIRKTIDFAKKLDNETIQVWIAHPYPGTEFYDYAVKNDLISIGNIVDDRGNQLPKVIYPGLDEAELMDWVDVSTANTISGPASSGAWFAKRFSTPRNAAASPRKRANTWRSAAAVANSFRSSGSRLPCPRMPATEIARTAGASPDHRKLRAKTQFWAVVSVSAMWPAIRPSRMACRCWSGWASPGWGTLRSR